MGFALEQSRCTSRSHNSNLHTTIKRIPPRLHPVMSTMSFSESPQALQPVERTDFAVPTTRETEQEIKETADPDQLASASEVSTTAVQMFGSALGDLIPVGFTASRIPEDLLVYMRDSFDVFGRDKFDPEALKNAGFARCVDHRRVPDHIYFEGYFHSHVGANGTIKDTILSMNPRRGINFEKPAAPIRIIAFYEAFRQLNATWFAALTDSLPNNPCGNIYRRKLKQGHAFSDLAIQIHFGDEIKDENIGWHSDTVNSALHMAVALRGDRALHSMLSETGKVDPNDFQDKTVEVVHPQSSGSVYVSSPWAFFHGVEYSECLWDNCIIAVQARFLMTREELTEIAGAHGRAEVLKAITSNLVSKPLAMPTLQEVRAVEEVIRSPRKKSCIVM